MKCKNGFGLIELLFVMVILAIVALIAYPSILNTYNKAKRDSFLTDAKTVIRVSKEKYQTNSIYGNSHADSYSSFTDNNLDLSNSNLKYCVDVDDKGSILSSKITNGSFYIEGTGDEISNSKVDSISFGDFDKFDCDYVLSDLDILKMNEIKGISEDDRIRFIYGSGIAFVITTILLIISKKNS